jgi:hypothetical protein
LNFTIPSKFKIQEEGISQALRAEILNIVECNKESNGIVVATADGPVLYNSEQSLLFSLFGGSNVIINDPFVVITNLGQINSRAWYLEHLYFHVPDENIILCARPRINNTYPNWNKKGIGKQYPGPKTIDYIIDIVSVKYRQ